MKTKFKSAFMDTAERFAQLSSAKRLQVGAIIVKDNRIISIGYNGMPSGWDNVCEIEQQSGWIGKKKLVSKPEVLHAEANAITKLAKSTNSSEGSTVYITASPCFECSKHIIQSGIKRVVFKDIYRKTESLSFLFQAGIEVVRIGELN